MTESLDEETFPDVAEDAAIGDTTVRPLEETANGENDKSSSEVVADSEAPLDPEDESHETENLKFKEIAATGTRDNSETATDVTREGNSTFYSVASPYTDLVKDLEKCLNDISVPTAPVVGE